MKQLEHYLNEPVSTLTHVFGAVASLIGTGWLLWLVWGDWTRVITLSIFGLSMTAMYCASSLLHGIKPRPRLQFQLNRLDHMSIFLLIAGTYTPIVTHFFPHSWRWPILLIVWLAALAGITTKLFGRRIHGFFNTSIYLVVSWGGVLPLILAGNAARWLPSGGIFLLLLGGFIYSAGFVVYYCRWPDPKPNLFGHHEVWHLFVLGGSLCHFLFMLNYVAR
ncbi:FIG01964566: Predicted membrane protein, hemolysin III homolog [hydrothermal vent metagenome]|uniref:FIG01964566: Predicted membrane protein, hemolysin III homolog n=2 Tax=hydrothermal vent metagenome TaxID=652676 RepID=A0A3B0VB62_9ZZZZ